MVLGISCLHKWIVPLLSGVSGVQKEPIKFKAWIQLPMLAPNAISNIPRYFKYPFKVGKYNKSGRLIILWNSTEDQMDIDILNVHSWMKPFWEI